MKLYRPPFESNPVREKFATARKDLSSALIEWDEAAARRSEPRRGPGETTCPNRTILVLCPLLSPQYARATPTHDAHTPPEVAAENSRGSFEENGRSLKGEGV